MASKSWKSRRGEEEVSLAWLAERLRGFVDLNPDFEVAVDRLATWLASADDEDDDRARSAGRLGSAPPGRPAELRASSWMRAKSRRNSCASGPIVTANSTVPIHRAAEQPAGDQYASSTRVRLSRMEMPIGV